MNVWTWLSRRICPSCRPSQTVDRQSSIRRLEQTGEGLEQVGRELRRMTELMRDGPNPYLGDPPQTRKGGR